MKLADLLDHHNISQAALGELLGVRRQIVHQWIVRGVPAARLADIVTSLALPRPEAVALYAGEGFALPESLFVHAEGVAPAADFVETSAHSA